MKHAEQIMYVLMALAVLWVLYWLVRLGMYYTHHDTLP